MHTLSQITMVGFKQITLLFLGILPIYASPLVDKRSGEAIPDKYIITLKPGVSSSQVDSHLSWVADVHTRSLSRRESSGVDKVYSINEFNAYSGSFDVATISKIEESEQVSYPSASLALARPQNHAAR